MGAPDNGTFSDWIGREYRARDHFAPERARLMQVTIAPQVPVLQNGDPLPAGWQWLYFHEGKPLATLGRDGHAGPGAFLPPFSSTSRMWAGSTLAFHRPLPLGAEVERRSRIADITRKNGRSGQLWFVTLAHDYIIGGAKALSEKTTLVFRNASGAGDTPQQKETSSPVATEANFRKASGATSATNIDAVMLFRYSALTFNSHRIHYDADYCRQVEGYPGLVTHGPLMATLLMTLAEDSLGHGNLRFFSCRAHAPVFAETTLHCHAIPAETGGLKLWAGTEPEGRTAAMTATARGKS